MSQRKFEYSDSKSHKFWNIEIDGTKVLTHYGRIGTDGQNTAKECGSEDDAKKTYDKLINQKLKKGYLETGTAAKAEAAGDSGSGAVLSENMFLTTRDVGDIGGMTTFIGKRITDFESVKSIKKGDKHVYRIRIGWDDGPETFLKRLQEFLDSDASPVATGFVIGNWSPDPQSVDGVIKALVKGKDRLPELIALFVGDIGQEECEISWIEQSDMSPLLAAFPKLELLRVRGGQGLKFSKPEHKTLRALGIEAGGLSPSVVRQLCKAKFPELEHLELWLGTSDYGGDCEVNDLQPILKGKLFPKLKYLGLRNSEIADNIAGVIINSPIVKQIDTLDLSLGTLTDEGGNALLELPQDGNLKRLDLHHHYMSSAMTKKLNKLPFTVNTKDTQEPDDWGDGEMRFVAVGE